MHKIKTKKKLKISLLWHLIFPYMLFITLCNASFPTRAHEQPKTGKLKTHEVKKQPNKNEVIQVRCVEIQHQTKQRRQKKNQETRAVDHRDTTTEKSADYSVVLLVAPKAAGLGCPHPLSLCVTRVTWHAATHIKAADSNLNTSEPTPSFSERQKERLNIIRSPPPIPHCLTVYANVRDEHLKKKKKISAYLFGIYTGRKISVTSLQKLFLLTFWCQLCLFFSPSVNLIASVFSKSTF